MSEGKREGERKQERERERERERARARARGKKRKCAGGVSWLVGLFVFYARESGERIARILKNKLDWTFTTRSKV